jgi:hypothetical protein
MAEDINETPELPKLLGCPRAVHAPTVARHVFRNRQVGDGVRQSAAGQLAALDPSA